MSKPAEHPPTKCREDRARTADKKWRVIFQCDICGRAKIGGYKPRCDGIRFTSAKGQDHDTRQV